MLDAISASQLAMNVDQLKLQTINHNVANINTPSFKRELLESTEFNDLVHPTSAEAQHQLLKHEIATQGAVVQTNNPKDLALNGPGYFQVQGEQGIYYTRRGDFHLNQNGELVTATGEHVLGTGGVMQLEPGTLIIDKKGNVLVDNRRMDQVQLADFAHPEALHYVGNGLYQSEESPLPIQGNTQVLQGFIEQSNIKSIDEMLQMVSTARHFATNQKILRTADSMLATAINQLGESNV